MGHHFNKLSIPFLLIILAVTPATWSQSVLISEFLASNDDGLADEDGDFEDWIELYNQGDIAINLAGWYLSDDPEDLARWRFPSVELPAGGYLVLFASGKNRRDPTANLHTNFKLSSSGEYLPQPPGCDNRRARLLAALSPPARRHLLRASNGDSRPHRRRESDTLPGPGR